jgi:protein-L-isoaspartate(D-aspartate) O-methyltransferase
VSRSIVFEREDGRWRSRASGMCTFMPLRGIADDSRRVIPLTPDAAVTPPANREQAVDVAALAGVLDHPASQTWTGALFRGPESFEWLDLWLTCALPNGLSRMTTELPAVEAGLVMPQFGWGAMATTEGGNLAYLTLRPAQPAGGTGRRYEVGVTGHGPVGGNLADRVAEQIRSWDRDYRTRAVNFEVALATAPEPATATLTITTPHNRLLISWNGQLRRSATDRPRRRLQWS